MAFEKIKKIREKKGLTQNQTADLLKIKLKTYKNYEQGLREPRLKTLKQIADLFECSLDDLY